MGSYLTRQGFKKGDVIAYLGTNNPEFALLLLGCASIGVTLTTANPAYTEGRNCRGSGAGNRFRLAYDGFVSLTFFADSCPKIMGPMVCFIRQLISNYLVIN